MKKILAAVFSHLQVIDEPEKNSVYGMVQRIKPDWSEVQREREQRNCRERE